MTRFLISLSAAMTMLLGVVMAAEAPLTNDQAKRFVDTLPVVEALGKEFAEKGVDGGFNFDATPKMGEPFKPYSNAVAAMKQSHPGEYARLKKSVKPHGFTTEEWGSVGDRVMVAYLAIRMQEDDPRSLEMMADMDQSMISMMPPEMRGQMEGVFAMMETIKNAPEADRKAVKSVKPQLDRFMETAGDS